MLEPHFCASEDHRFAERKNPGKRRSDRRKISCLKTLKM